MRKKNPPSKAAVRREIKTTYVTKLRHTGPTQTHDPVNRCTVQRAGDSTDGREILPGDGQIANSDCVAYLARTDRVLLVTKHTCVGVYWARNGGTITILDGEVATLFGHRRGRGDVETMFALAC